MPPFVPIEDLMEGPPKNFHAFSSTSYAFNFSLYAHKKSFIDPAARCARSDRLWMRKKISVRVQKILRAYRMPLNAYDEALNAFRAFLYACKEKLYR